MLVVEVDEGGTELFVFTSSITDHFGNEPAETRDASGPHPDLDGSLFTTTAEHSKQENEANSPDASDCNFGGHWCLWSRFVSTDSYLTTTNFSLFRLWPSASNAVIPP